MAMSKGYNGGLLPEYQQIWKTCDPSTVSLEGGLTLVRGQKGRKREVRIVGVRQVAPRQPSLSLTFVCLQVTGSQQVFKRRVRGPPAGSPKQKKQKPVAAVPVVAAPVVAGGKGKGGGGSRNLTVTPQSPVAAASAVSGSHNQNASFNTSLSGVNLWAEIAAQAVKDNSMNVGRLKSRVSSTSTHITRSGATFDVGKLRAILGPTACLPVAVGTSGTAALNVVFCGKRGQPGHEHDGAAHAGLEKWAKDFNDRSTGAAYRAGFV
jgi:hypothetical protein